LFKFNFLILSLGNEQQYMLQLDQLLQKLSLLLFYSAPPCRATTWCAQQISNTTGHSQSSILAVGHLGKRILFFFFDFQFLIFNIFNIFFKQFQKVLTVKLKQKIVLY